MTPMSGFVRRLFGGSTPAAPATTSTESPRSRPRQADDSPDADSNAAGGQRRRRGRRGGRGRGRNRDENANGGTANSNAVADREETSSRRGQRSRSSSDRDRNDDRGRSGGRSRNDSDQRSRNDSSERSRGGQARRNGNGRGNRNNDNRRDDGGRDGNGGEGQRGRGNGSGQASKENYKWGGVARGDRDRGQLQQRRQRAGQRRGFRRPSRDSLEVPLPEDVAFRSVDEGGAGDILPARRRRPKGLRSTERIIVGGARSLSGIPRTLSGPIADPALTRDGDRDDSRPRDDDSSSRDRDGDRSARRDSRRDDRDDRRDEDERAEIAADLDDDRSEAVAEAPARAEGDDAEEQPKRRRGRRGGRRERERRDAREAALARAEAEEDDEVPVDHDHAIEAIEELPEIVEQEIEDSEEELEIPAAFADLGLGDESLAAIARLGFTDPTPIQARAIPELIDGHDVVGLAQTGSGKTLAFGLPMVERIDPELEEVQAIVLVPTRELAQQVLDVLTDLGRSYGLRTIGLLGGHALKRDFAALREQPQIVVGTPGRIIDHLRRETLSLRQVSYAVLDEADQMLDIGFLPDIRRILGRTPKRRQTALFSATMPTSIRRLIWQFMDDPVTARVDAELSTVDSVEQIYFEVAQRDKTAGVRELVEGELKGRTLVFCKMKRGVDRLAQDLEGRGVRVGALHGDMDQRRRDRVVERFRAGELDILIATNVAARGLDIPEITHVVNYDVPQNAEEYLHRIGRTGRAGRDGKAITFVGEWEFDEFQRVLDEFGDQLTKQELDLYATD